MISAKFLIESGILKNTTRYQEIATSGEAFAQDYPQIADVIVKEAEKEPDQKRKWPYWKVTCSLTPMNTIRTLRKRENYQEAAQPFQRDFQR